MTNENTPNFSPSYEELLIYSLWAAIKNVIPQDAGFSAKQLELMSSMIQEQKASNSIQEKLLRAAAS
jgi:hypothetical protein